MYWRKGKARRLTLGVYPEMKVAEALSKYADAKQALDGGLDPATEIFAERRTATARRAELEADTVLSVVARFMLKHGRKKRSRWETVRMFKVNVLPATTGTDPRPWRDRPIEEIDQRDIIALLNGLDSTPYMKNRVLAAVRKLFNWAASQAIVTSVPVFKGLAAEEQSRNRVFDDDEIKTLWNAAAVYPFGPALRLMFTTGARRSEIFDLTWREIDMGKKMWTLPAERAKNGVRHELPLSDLAVEVLESLPRLEGPYLFSTTSGKKPFRGYSKAKGDLAADLDFDEPWRLHDLRRSVGSGLQALRFSRDVIGAVLNHAKGGGATPIYMRHDYSHEKLEALTAWGRRLEQIITGKSGAGKVVELRPQAQ
jgi:integrase